MDERFYYSGGSVRECTRELPDAIRIEVMETITKVDASATQNSSSSIIRSGPSHLNRLRRTFVDDANVPNALISREHWKQVIDSEFAVLALNLRLRSDTLLQTFTWDRGTGHGTLAGSVFEMYLHRLAADMLRLYMSEYEPPSTANPKNSRYLRMEKVPSIKGDAICSGNTRDHVDDLERWMINDESTYWFPACHDFPNIDSIVKLQSTSGECRVAYLQYTVASKHTIDDKQLERMNAIFYPDKMKKTEGAEPPIYIAVCPDLESCKILVLKPSPAGLAANKVCQVFVGYCRQAAYAIAMDRPVEKWHLKPSPDISAYNLQVNSRKRSRQ